MAGFVCTDGTLAWDAASDQPPFRRRDARAGRQPGDTALRWPPKAILRDNVRMRRASLALPVLGLVVASVPADAAAPRSLPLGSTVLAEGDCPPETVLQGGRPPEAEAVWCGTTDRAGRLIPHGPYLGYFRGGQVAERGQFGRGQREGAWVTWSEDGRMRASSTYRAGVLDGPWEGEGEGGVWLTGAFRKGKRDGMWRMVARDGRELGGGAWKAGRRDGMWRETMDDGTTGEGAYKADLRQGPWRFSWPSGEPRTSGVFAKGEKTGRWEERDAEGVLRARGRWKGDVRVGVWESWGSDGRPEWAGETRDGLRTGPWTEWTQEGERQAGSYARGLRTGPWTRWHRDGAVASRGPMVDDRMHGAWEFLDPSGRVVGAGAMVAGERDGAWVEADTGPDPEVRWTGRYAAGRRVGRWVATKADGTEIGARDFDVAAP